MSETNVAAWWRDAFTEAEREYVRNKYWSSVATSGPGGGDLVLPDGKPRISLVYLAAFFTSPKEALPLAMRILHKGLDIGADKHGTALDQHFTLGIMIKVYYSNRANGTLDLAIATCERQIALAPVAAKMFKREQATFGAALPHHGGFEQLAIIREKERNYGEAIQLSKEAYRQGWAGDWVKRIARCEKKREKA